jgi:hypothetical protein
MAFALQFHLANHETFALFGRISLWGALRPSPVPLPSAPWQPESRRTPEARQTCSLERRISNRSARNHLKECCDAEFKKIQLPADAPVDAAVSAFGNGLPVSGHPKRLRDRDATCAIVAEIVVMSARRESIPKHWL